MAHIKAMKILKGHILPETAYVVDDYPYSYTLRCKTRYWLEYKAGKGFRFMSQTTNPKRGHFWNKPRASIYRRYGGCMYLVDNMVKWAGLTEYSTGAEAQRFLDTYGEGVPEAGQELLRRWVAAKVAYDAARKPGDPTSVGLVEAAKAFNGDGNGGGA